MTAQCVPNWDVGNVGAGVMPIVGGGAHGAAAPGAGGRSKLNDSVFHTVLSTVLRYDGYREKMASASAESGKRSSRDGRAADEKVDTLVDERAAAAQDGSAGAAVQTVADAVEQVDKPTNVSLTEGVGAAALADVDAKGAQALFDVEFGPGADGRTAATREAQAFGNASMGLPGAEQGEERSGAVATGAVDEATSSLLPNGVGQSVTDASNAASGTHNGAFQLSSVPGFEQPVRNGALTSSVDSAVDAADGAVVTGRDGDVLSPRALNEDSLTPMAQERVPLRESRTYVTAEEAMPTEAAAGDSLSEPTRSTMRLSLTAAMESGTEAVEDGEAVSLAGRAAEAAARTSGASADTVASLSSEDVRPVQTAVGDAPESADARGEKGPDSTWGGAQFSDRGIDSSRSAADSANTSTQRVLASPGTDTADAYAFGQSANDGTQAGTTHVGGAAAATFGTGGVNGANSFASTLATSDGLGESVMSQLRAPMEDIVAELVRTPARDGVEQVSIRLRPEFLGEVVMRIAVDADGVVTARFVAEHAFVRNMIEQQLPELRAALSEHGLQLGDASVAGGEAGLAWDDGAVPDDAPQPVGTAGTYGPDIDKEDNNDAVADLEPSTGGIDIRV